MICKTNLAMRGAVALFAALTIGGCDDEPAAETPIEQARSYLSQGDGLAAEVALREALAAGSPRADLAAYLGEAELQQGQLAEAGRWLRPGDFSTATTGRGFHVLGRLEMREGNLPAAGQAFDRAYAVQPEDPELWVDIGRLRYRGGEQLQAVEASERAVQYGPQNPAALLFRAQLVRDSRGFAEGLVWFERALAVNPDDIDLLEDYAATLGELGEATAMLATVRTIMERDPGNSQGFYLQAVLAARAGHNDLARSLLLRSNMLERDVPAALLLSGIVDLRSGNYASAAQTLDQLALVAPNNRRVAHLLARALLLSGAAKELLFRFADAAELPGASPYLQTTVARGYETIGDRVEAARMLHLASRPRDGTLIALRAAQPIDVARIGRDGAAGDTLSRVRNAVTGGNSDAAVAIADGVAKRLPGSADALGLFGDTLYANGDRRGALARYSDAARVRQPWLLTRRMVAAAQGIGDAARAQALLDATIQGGDGQYRGVAPARRPCDARRGLAARAKGAGQRPAPRRKQRSDSAGLACGNCAEIGGWGSGIGRSAAGLSIAAHQSCGHRCDDGFERRDAPRSPSEGAPIPIMRAAGYAPTGPSRRLCRTDHHSDMPINVAPIRPVIVSGIWNTTDVSMIAPSAMIAQNAPCSR